MTLLTEEEAKTKWCPMAREIMADPSTLANVAISGVAFNRIFDLEGECITTKCIASGCAMWWWGASSYEYCETKWRSGSGNMIVATKPEGDGWEMMDGYGNPRWRRLIVGPRGFCGLSGKPEVT